MKFLKWPVMALASVLTLTSCSSDDNDAPELPTEEEGIVVSFNNKAIVYDAEGVWQDCASLNAPELVFDKFVFSHNVEDWGGYVSWDGFCPSVSTDKEMYPESWTSHQWSSVTGGAVDGAGKPYMVAYWSGMEVFGSVPEEPSCMISCQDGAFKPLEVYVTLTTWSYSDMKFGGYGHKFEDSDWCKLHIYGVVDDEITKTIEVSLASGADILDTWKKVDLREMGVVDFIFFQMSSSDTSYGFMNNASYFCLDKLRVD